MKTEFPRAHLAAVSHFMASKDIRYYLVGVYVEVLALQTRLVATDGAAVGATCHVRTNEAPFDVIIPEATVDMALKMPAEFVQLERDDAGRWYLAGIPFTPVDGRFPDYRRIIPENWSGEAAHFDPNLLMRFVKAAKALKHKGVPIVRNNGTTPALVHFYGVDDFVGVISPYNHFREKEPDLGAPSWGRARY